MERNKITNLADCRFNQDGALTVDALKSAAKATRRPQVAQFMDTRWLIICPGGAVMGTSQPYTKDEAYDLAFRVALARDWSWPVVAEGVIGL